jgi:hypothetical protein
VKRSAPEAAVGFRVKSGWAAGVLVGGSVDSPQVLDRRRLELCDPSVPASLQPYHAGMGKLQTDQAKLRKLLKMIGDAANHSFKDFWTENRAAGRTIASVNLVVGSDIDPEKIANPHIRAHALEGRLFRSVLENAARSAGLPCVVIVERDLYARAKAAIQRSERDLKTTLRELGRVLGGPWRADDKAACLIAWMALAAS